MLKTEVIKSFQEMLKEKGIKTTKDEATIIHDAIFENLGNILASGEEVSIINFGTFYSNYSVKNNIGKRIKENVASTIQVFILKFRVSHNLKERLNGKKTK